MINPLKSVTSIQGTWNQKQASTNKGRDMRCNTKVYVWGKNKENWQKDKRKKVIDGIMIEDYDRRKEEDSSYNGPERRSGEDRRSEKDKKLILLITENPDDERLALSVFKKNNIVNEVQVATYGAEVLNYLFDTGIYPDRNLKIMPQVILLNLNLHKIDGLEVLKRLRNEERTKLLPVVAFSSSEDERDLTECYMLGANSYVRRPLDSALFEEIISHLVMYWIFFNESPS
jgi:CheY-like chemotaxis protein